MENIKTVEVPFNGIENEYLNLVSKGIEIVGLSIGRETNGNVHAKLKGDKEKIVSYLSDLWNVKPDGDEIKELDFK